MASRAIDADYLPRSGARSLARILHLASCVLHLALQHRLDDPKGADQHVSPEASSYFRPGNFLVHFLNRQWKAAKIFPKFRCGRQRLKVGQSCARVARKRGRELRNGRHPPSISGGRKSRLPSSHFFWLELLLRQTMRLLTAGLPRRGLTCDSVAQVADRIKRRLASSCRLTAS